MTGIVKIMMVVQVHVRQRWVIFAQIFVDPYVGMD